MQLGVVALAVVLVAVAGLAIASYWASHDEDPGLTGEVALLLTPVLAAFARHEPAMAAALGVVAAILLQAKRPLHRLAREVISEGEIHDVRSEEHTSELQSLMRISYAVFCLKKKKYNTTQYHSQKDTRSV